MINKLTKNFNFLENKKYFNSHWISKAIDYISNIEKLDNPDKNIQDVSNALECLLNEFIKKHELFLFENIQLSDKIRKIEETGRLSSRFLFNIMHGIRNSRNYVVHKHDDNISYNLKMTNLDVLSKLKNLFEITITLFEDESNELNLPSSFDEKCYGDKYKRQDIGAISQAQRENDNKSFRGIQDDLKIDKDSMISWLSIPRVKLLIPIYQRKYEWKNKHVDVLFNDILDRVRDGEEHYFGTIAQKRKNGLGINSPDEIKIIDGQQRLTTSLLFLCAARQITLEQKWKKSIEDIDWYQKIVSKHTKPKNLSNYIHNPGGTDLNNKNFIKILDNVDGKTIDELGLDLKTQFADNYNYIYKKMKEKLNSFTDISNFINTFLHQFYVASISFDSNKFSNKREMEIFENLNSKGLDLGNKDLIKNYLFNYCSDELLNKHDNDITLRYNQIVESTKIEKSLENFYDKIAEFVRGEELDSEKRDRFIQTRDALDKFLNQNKFTNEIDSINEYDKMMSYLENYMYLHAEIQNNNFNFIKFIKCDKIIDIIFDRKKKQLFTYFLFIIYNIIQKKFNNKFNFISYSQEFYLSKSEILSIQELFLEVTKFIIRTKVITKQGDSKIKRLILEITSEYFDIDLHNYSIEQLCKEVIFKINNKTTKNYPFAEFKRNLQNISASQAMELLILTETIMANSLFGGGEEINRQNKSIEHILPHDYSKWINNAEDKQKFKEDAESHKEKLGNYLILSQKKNSKAQNEAFSVKQYKVYSDLVSPLYNNKQNKDIDVSSKKEWTFDDINKRTNALIEYILENVITK